MGPVCQRCTFKNASIAEIWTYRVGQNTRQVRKKTLVDRKRTLCLHRPDQAIERAAVKITSLVVHAAHDRVGRVHENTDHETRARRGHQVKCRTFLHAQMSYKPPLREEVCGELHTRSKTGSYHGGNNAAVETLDTLGLVDLLHTIGGVAVIVLGSNRKERRVGLQAGLDEEERRASCGTENTGGGTREDVHGERLQLTHVIVLCVHRRAVEDQGVDAAA